MPATLLKKIAAKTAAEVIGAGELLDQGLPTPRDGAPPADYLDGLIQQGLHVEAVKFLSQALPKREAVWWACVCVKSAQSATPLPKDLAAHQAAREWVLDPNEDRRRAAFAAAETAGFASPAGSAALAVFLSGGSLGPPNIADVPPAESLTGQSVAGAVMLAAVVSEPQKAPTRYAKFLADGVEIAKGGLPWA